MTLKNCWQVLQMQPTNDLDAIRRTRRSLIKQWHPDTGPTAGTQPELTTRSAEINAACDQALGIARTWTPSSSPQRTATESKNSLSTDRDIWTHRSRFLLIVLILSSLALKTLVLPLLVLGVFATRLKLNFSQYARNPLL